MAEPTPAPGGTRHRAIPSFSHSLAACSGAAPRQGLTRAAMTNIRQNVTMALGLKAVFLVTSVLGLTGLWIAIMADTGATVLVTLNALRLLRFNPEREG